MRVLLMGDIHLYRLAIWPWHLLSKRVLGQTNLWLCRRHRFDPKLVERIIEQVESLNPTGLLCPGDLTTTATHREFRLARRTFGDLFSRFPSLVLPGNHDRYTFAAARTERFERYFGDWSADAWPRHVVWGDDLHVLGIDATRPNVLFDKGKVGRDQLDRLAGELARIDRAARVIVMGHYTPGCPPTEPAESKWHALVDEAALCETLREADRPIVFVHGHVHRPWCWRMADAPQVVAINTGSPTHVSERWPRGQGLWELVAAQDEAAPWRIVRHTLDEQMQWQANDVAWPEAPGEAVGV